MEKDKETEAMFHLLVSGAWRRIRKQKPGSLASLRCMEKDKMETEAMFHLLVPSARRRTKRKQMAGFTC
jgi:hypothetical protein